MLGEAAQQAGLGANAGEVLAKIVMQSLAEVRTLTLLQGHQGLGQLGVVGLHMLQGAGHGVEMPSQHLRLGDAMGGQTHIQLALGDLLQPAE